MKNIIKVIAFLFLFYNTMYSQNSNYLNDGGFEQGISGILTNINPPFTYNNNALGIISRPSCLSDYSDEGHRINAINSNCPGGFAGMRYKMQYWRSRGDFSVNGCNAGSLECYPHLSDWLYTNPNWPSTNDQFTDFNFLLGWDETQQYNGAVSSIIAQSGMGCAGAQPYCMVQQGMNNNIGITGSYYMSGFMKKMNSSATTTIPTYSAE